MCGWLDLDMVMRDEVEHVNCVILENRLVNVVLLSNSEWWSVIRNCVVCACRVPPLVFITVSHCFFVLVQWMFIQWDSRDLWLTILLNYSGWWSHLCTSSCDCKCILRAYLVVVSLVLVVSFQLSSNTLIYSQEWHSSHIMTYPQIIIT